MVAQWESAMKASKGFDLSGTFIPFFLSPLWGLFIFSFAYPRLAPWAVFFRRFAAGLVECPTFCGS
jgi:hypothetical protein